MASAAPPTPAITGTTDVYLILGDPVEQVRAPEAFNRIFAQLGIDAVLVPVRVAPADLAAFVRTAFAASNIKGMWVTIPHKAPVLALLDGCTELGRVAGAVNAIRRMPDGRIEGALFDGEGFVAGLDHAGIAYSGKRVLIIGAGGGSSAIAASLACAGAASAAEIAFYDPVPGKAQQVAQRIAQASASAVRAVDSSNPAGFDLVVNGSPLGLQPDDPMPCDVSRMEPHAALVDILMKNQPTPVVRAARERGLVAQPGFEMMIQQTPLYLEFFGFHEAAQAVRQDATFLRELIYPAQLHGEIRRPAATGFPIPGVEGSRLAPHSPT
ncbi:MAG: shikimate dehydrogenase family protein [Burkholderiaceae bacterium]